MGESQDTQFKGPRKNRRGMDEYFVKRQHLALPDLKEKARGVVQNQYLIKENIPLSPKPEFRVRLLKHDTDQVGVRGIREKCGFIGRPQHDGSPSLLWWSLVVKPEDIEAAERALVAANQELPEGQHFLEKFATSPAFSETSRLGGYRFTFTVEELLEAYKGQFCSGEEPMMRVLETVLYSQEVMYVVLIHRPKDQEKFSEYPLLPREPGPLCTYSEGQFVWRTQAMCETHRYQLGNQFEVVELSPNQIEFYVWDIVSIAFHLDEDEVLRFDADHLGTRVTTCEKAIVTVNRKPFDDLDTAKAVVKDLWPASPDKN